MAGEDCKCLHPASCRKYMENPKRCRRHNTKATLQNSGNILVPQGNVAKIGRSEYISRALGASKPHLRPKNQVQLRKLQINNKQ